MLYDDPRTTFHDNATPFNHKNLNNIYRLYAMHFKNLVSTQSQLNLRLRQDSVTLHLSDQFHVEC